MTVQDGEDRAAHLLLSKTAEEVPALPPHETVPAVLLTSQGLLSKDLGGKWRGKRAFSVVRDDGHVSGNPGARAAEKGTVPLAVLLTHWLAEYNEDLVALFFFKQNEFNFDSSF